MAVVGHRRRQQIMAFHGVGTAPSHAILAAASSVPFYQSVLPQQDVQPDRPIGYGAFGVVWYDPFVLKIYLHFDLKVSQYTYTYTYLQLVEHIWWWM